MDILKLYVCASQTRNDEPETRKICSHVLTDEAAHMNNMASQ